MDNDFAIDMREVFQLIDSAEVLVVRFPLIDRRLLMDARASDLGPQLVLAPRVHSLDERFRFLRESRPGVPVPERIMFIPWPKRVDSFVKSGAWTRITERVESIRGSHAAIDYAQVLEELRRREQQETIAAVAGTGYKPIWQRRS